MSIDDHDHDHDHCDHEHHDHDHDHDHHDHEHHDHEHDHEEPALKIDVTDVSPVKKIMSIEIGADLVARESKAVLNNYARKARIPGFRPGKAPLSVIKTRFKQEVEEDVRERVITRYYHKATQAKGLHPLGDPVVDEIDFAEGEPLRFKTTFEVLPKIELKDWKGIEVRRPKTEVRNEEVDESLEHVRQSHTKLAAVEEGATATTGDVMVADLTGTPDEGEPFGRERMFIEIGGTEHLPAFNDRLEGAKPGDELDFAVDYPTEYAVQELAGKSVRYRILVHEIKRKLVPELDDEFAKDLGDFQDLAALRERLRHDLQHGKQRDAENSIRNGVLDKVLLANPIVLPDLLVEVETRQRLEAMIGQMMRQGLDPEKMELDWADLRKRQEEPARKSVHARLILDQIAADQSLEVPAEELEERIRQQALRMQESPAKLRKELEKRGGLNALKTQLLREKSLDLLTSVANIQNEE